MSTYTSKIFVTVDILVINNETEEILLIKRLNEPFKDCWALPGGFVDENEDLEAAAHRELKEETNLEVEELYQIGAFGTPGRDPRGHMISIAYLGYSNDTENTKAMDDAKELKWFNINNLPKLAFDHREIIEMAITE
ncbi:MutT/nudix family protein [Flavobacterium indicum GPTSA100-9 = DSM 17447]|uniref:MutT/nudix family protein n=1 Tax=Flavobacterium indicum (strain DSM 17447 / CIP 109464 / GPTSA100-9) TaxID=1094466 RepID=H8XQP7_FLAIG|nr:NUDIX hydrolase [Flavobacterium indicum]CCG53345.1 MutT/nudix family protein [Flavobacterium indicum GPTSA100-9 = DSM 17447]